MRKKFTANTNGKIVRDLYLEGTTREDSSAKIAYRYLTGRDLQLRLLEKLIEETSEVCDAKDLQSLTEELADVLQVIETIRKHNNISKNTLSKVMREKNKTRGAFDKGLFFESVELDYHSELCKYYLKYPEKYPEVSFK